MGTTLERWSPEMIEAARVMFMQEGQTINYCAKALGVTRSAMAGIARRQGWFGTNRGNERPSRAKPEGHFAKRRTWDVGQPIKATDYDLDALRRHKENDAAFSRMVLREAVQRGLIQVRP